TVQLRLVARHRPRSDRGDRVPPHPGGPRMAVRPAAVHHPRGLADARRPRAVARPGSPRGGVGGLHRPLHDAPGRQDRAARGEEGAVSHPPARGIIMTGRCLLIALLPLAAAVGLAQKPADPPANAEHVAAALKLTQAAAAEYE